MFGCCSGAKAAMLVATRWLPTNDALRAIDCMQIASDEREGEGEGGLAGASGGP